MVSLVAKNRFNDFVHICDIHFSVAISITFIGFWCIGNDAILGCITNDVDKTAPHVSCLICLNRSFWHV